MGISLKKWLLAKLSTDKEQEISCKELLEDVENFQIRELAFEVCANLIANAIGKCEFKTYEGGVEFRGDEYYTWNVEPNHNQNSSEFLHKLIFQLLRNNEALVVDVRSRNGSEMLYIADSFTATQDGLKATGYSNVCCGDYRFERSFKEQDVLHFKLNNKNIEQVSRALGESYAKLIEDARSYFSYHTGQHWKVHIDSINSGHEDFEENFNKFLNTQFKAFINAKMAVLPEENGYDYQNIAQSTGYATTSRDIKALANDIFEFTARGMAIPYVLLSGEVADTSDALNRWLTLGIDPLCEQLQEEINRKRYGRERFKRGDYLFIDTSSMVHFDMFSNAANIEKLIGSGVFSINDVRKACGQEAVKEPWADKYYLTKNFSLVEDI